MEKNRISHADYSVSAIEIPSEPFETPMKKVPSNEKQILYNLTDKNARKNYLKERYQRSPREKYHFPEATSWRYGWHA